MAKEKSVPAQTSKDVEKDSLAAKEMILPVATFRGDLDIWDAGRHSVRAPCALHRAAWHPQPA
jgi:hypothetical protein